MITAEQIRAARGMLRMDQAVLARKAGVSVETIKRLERGTGMLKAQEETLIAIKLVLEREGIEFLDEKKEELAGAGVRIVEDWSKVFRLEMRKAVENVVIASSTLHEQEDSEFFRRGQKHVFETVLKDFTEQLKRELRDWPIEEPQGDRRTRSGRKKSG